VSEAQGTGQPADFLVIGGGTAGSVMAAQLSEDPHTRVLLVEAGADTPPAATPADIRDTFPSSSLNPAYFWPGLTAVRSDGRPPRPFPQARVMGGGSSVMGLWALRGLPADYDAWVDAGADGWGWGDVCETFRRIEDDADRPALSGAPMRIRRVPRHDWPAFLPALERAAAARGLSAIDDINEEPGDGFFPMPVSQSADRRSGNAACYLTEAVRRRPNLEIMAEATATELLFDGSVVTGARLMRGGETTVVTARHVVLSAGAVHSPALLMRSGIGDAGALAAAGIAVRAERVGVGRNLQNHAYLHFALTLPPRLRMPAALRRFALAGIRVSSGHPGSTAGDLLLFAIGRVSPRGFGTAVAMVGAALYAPFSRGSVTLAGPDARTPPAVAFRMFSDARDGPRMIAAARAAEGLLREPEVAARYGELFLLPPVMSLQQFNQPGLSGTARALAATLALDAPAPIRRRLFERGIRPGRWLGPGTPPLDDREILDAAAPMAHPAGTCAMGRADDPAAVTDARGGVHGVGGLTVADASIMPRLPSANTNLPTTMVAERIASALRRRRSEPA
jgi:5-(hydroxymethyl)furfural/furfural oxidase